MGFLKSQLNRIQEQLGGLSATQKMLVGALVMIMIMTLYGWVNFAGKAEMETLIDQTLAPEEIARITQVLAAQGIKAQLVGDRIQVPATQKLEAWGALGYAGALPGDTKNAVEDLISKSNPFQSDRMSNELVQQAKQAWLAQVLRHFPGVHTAAVGLQPLRQRAIGGAGAEPTASANLSMKPGGKTDQKLVNAVADFIAGTVPGLDRSRVNVIIDGASYRARAHDPASGGGDEWLDQIQKAQKHWTETVKAQLGWIDGVMVTVAVKANQERSQIKVYTVDPKNVVTSPVLERTSNQDTQSNRKDAGEPGVGSNSPLAVNDAPSASEKNSGTTETNETQNQVAYGSKEQTTWRPAGETPAISASVLVPRSFMVQAFKKITGSDKEPDPTKLETWIAAELQKCKTTVKNCLALATENDVQVDTYIDLMPLAGAMPQSAATSSMSLLVTDHVKEVALGVLALVSLFMVSNMVKKGTPAPVVAAPIPSKPPQRLAAAEESVGEASEGTALLDGMELDEDSVKAQQMLGQVSDMVGSDPDSAAKLVKRWLNRA